MKADEIIDAMGFLDDDLVASAMQARNGYYKKRKKARVISFSVLAAAALVAVVTVSTMLVGQRQSGAGQGGQGAAPGSQGDAPAAQSTQPPRDLAYVDVNDLLAPEGTGEGVLQDGHKVGATDGSSGDGGSSVQASEITLTIHGLHVAYKPAAVSAKGQKMLPDSKGDLLTGNKGWYLLLGHKDTDYLIQERDGIYSLWQKAE